MLCAPEPAQSGRKARISSSQRFPSLYPPISQEEEVGWSMSHGLSTMTGARRVPPPGTGAGPRRTRGRAGRWASAARKVPRFSLETGMNTMAGAPEVSR